MLIALSSLQWLYCWFTPQFRRNEDGLERRPRELFLLSAAKSSPFGKPRNPSPLPLTAWPRPTHQAGRGHLAAAEGGLVGHAPLHQASRQELAPVPRRALRQRRREGGAQPALKPRLDKGLFHGGALQASLQHSPPPLFVLFFRTQKQINLRHRRGRVCAEREAGRAGRELI